MILCRKKYLKFVCERLNIKKVLCYHLSVKKIRFKIVTQYCHFIEYTCTYSFMFYLFSSL